MACPTLHFSRKLSHLSKGVHEPKALKLNTVRLPLKIQASKIKPCRETSISTG